MNVLIILTLIKLTQDVNNDNKARHIAGNVIYTARIGYKNFKHLQLSHILV
jgi:hypothetical protein